MHCEDQLSVGTEIEKASESTNQGTNKQQLIGRENREEEEEKV